MKDGGIFMSKKEQFAHQVILDFLGARLTRAQAAELLQVRERTISRMARRIQCKGIEGAVHGNRNRSPVNRTPEQFRKDVMTLIERRYFDFNMVHAIEMLKEEQKIELKYSTFRRWCHEAHLVKRRHKRRSYARHKRVRMPNEGLLLQFDGSPHYWNGKEQWCLIAGIDDATSDIPHAEFFLAEDTINCMTVMQKIIERKGIPYSIYVDRAGWFGGQKRQMFAQFKRACEELGTRVIFANSAEAKGRIERAWKTFQDRLIPEMRLRNIRRIPAANEYLINQFLPNYWRIKNTVAPASLENRYKTLSPKIDLNEVFCLKEYRSIKKDHTLSWQGTEYRIESPFKYSLYRQHIEFRTYQNLTTEALFAGRPVLLSPVEKTSQKSAA
jgi:transposase